MSEGKKKVLNVICSMTEEQTQQIVAAMKEKDLGKMDELIDAMTQETKRVFIAFLDAALEYKKEAAR